MRMILLAPALSAAALPFAALAQPASATPSQADAIAAASRTGALLYALDRATWVGSDAAVEAFGRERLAGVGGYVVEPGDKDRLLVTFFRGEGATARAFFRATVQGGQVVARDKLAVPAQLTGPQAALAAARTLAGAEAVRRGYAPCTAAPFNTVTVPPLAPGDPIEVYLLSAQLSTDSWPLGGHYRVTVQDGTVRSARPFSRSCLDMTLPRLPSGAKPAGLFVNHVLDAIPTEIHVFTSYAARLPLFVAIRGERVWAVTGARITPTAMKPPAPPR